MHTLSTHLCAPLCTHIMHTPMNALCTPQVEACDSRLAEVLKVADIEAARARLALLENDASAGNVWEDSGRAQALMTQVNMLRCGGLVGCMGASWVCTCARCGCGWVGGWARGCGWVGGCRLGRHMESLSVRASLTDWGVVVSKVYYWAGRRR